VLMRCTDYDLALPIIDIREGHVLVSQVTQPAQKPWVGLTDEEISKLQHLIDWTAHWSYGTFAKAIEALLKEKNT